jgi:ribosomal protein S18 acetylase RimI-like enzyme
MNLTDDQADQIAVLLNARNQLTRELTRNAVLDSAVNYQCRFSESGAVVGCVEVKRVQWYQAEICHLTVSESEAKKGHAKALLREAEKSARLMDVRLLQCTIREDNVASRRLFEGFGFVLVGMFHNRRSGNNVGVFQKILALAQQ